MREKKDKIKTLRGPLAWAILYKAGLKKYLGPKRISNVKRLFKEAVRQSKANSEERLEELEEIK